MGPGRSRGRHDRCIIPRNASLQRQLIQAQCEQHRIKQVNENIDFEIRRGALVPTLRLQSETGQGQGATGWSGYPVKREVYRRSRVFDLRQTAKIKVIVELKIAADRGLIAKPCKSQHGAKADQR